MTDEQLRQVSIKLANAWFELDDALKIIPSQGVQTIEDLHADTVRIAEDIHTVWKRIRDLKRS